MYSRINKLRKAEKLTWEELAQKAGIKVSTWMTGLPFAKPTDEELEAIAPVLHTTFDYLKYGTR